MSLYIRLTTQALMDPKLVAAGPEGFTLYIKGLLWSKEQLTDGMVSEDVLPLIGVGLKNAKATANHLVKLNLWTPCEGGWTVGSEKWSQWQNTKADVEKSRQEARDRKARSRQKREQSQDGHTNVTRDIYGVSRESHSDVTQPEHRAHSTEHIAQSTEPLITTTTTTTARAPEKLDEEENSNPGPWKGPPHFEIEAYFSGLDPRAYPNIDPETTWRQFRDYRDLHGWHLDWQSQAQIWARREKPKPKEAPGKAVVSSRGRQKWSDLYVIDEQTGRPVGEE